MKWTIKKIESIFPVSVVKFSNPGHGICYHAFCGGNGTGRPVMDIAKADSLATLARRIQKTISTGM